MIPMLTHVDNLGDINLDMTTQEQSLETIASNTSEANSHLVTIENRNDAILREIADNSIPTVSEIKSTIGRTTDADTATTVIGLLKSIANKLS